jgi:hypothetical protein
MQTLIRHRFPNSENQLVLDDWQDAKFAGENPGRFSVSYLESTIDWDAAERNEPAKKCFNYCMSQHFHDYNEALRIFRLRRDSENPFNPYKE